MAEMWISEIIWLNEKKTEITIFLSISCQPLKNVVGGVVSAMEVPISCKKKKRKKKRLISMFQTCVHVTIDRNRGEKNPT